MGILLEEVKLPRLAYSLRDLLMRRMCFEEVPLSDLQSEIRRPKAFLRGSWDGHKAR